MWSDGSGAYRDTSPCAVALASFNFAEILKNNLAGIPNLSYRYTVERDDYLPAHVDAPCILYEGGYLSNPNEAAYLASEQYQNEAAVRICNAIDQYFGGSGGVPDTTAPVINSVYTSATETTALDYSIECNVADDTGVGSVKFVTWTENNGQDDVIWQEGTNNGNGNYSAIVSSKDHNYEIGNYVISLVL